MGELLLGGQREREAEKKRGASYLGHRAQLRKEGTQLFEKRETIE